VSWERCLNFAEVWSVFKKASSVADCQAGGSIVGLVDAGFRGMEFGREE
jgi:hypothetical protein